MIVLVLEHVSEKVKGECTKYLLEIKPGVFLGNVTAQVRKLLWDMICYEFDVGGAMVAYSTNNEQGYNIEFSGDTTRKVVDMDGIQLIQYQTENIQDTKMASRVNKAGH